MAAPVHRHPRQFTQGLQAAIEAQAERQQEVTHQETPAEVPLAATDHQVLPTGLHQAMTILPARQEAQAATLQAGVQVHILPAVQAVAPRAAIPAADHQEALADPTAVAAAQEAAAEEGNH